VLEKEEMRSRNEVTIVVELKSLKGRLLGRKWEEMAGILQILLQTLTTNSKQIEHNL
jgi:hypothetical protein